MRSSSSGMTLPPQPEIIESSTIANPRLPPAPRFSLTLVTGPPVRDGLAMGVEEECDEANESVPACVGDAHQCWTRRVAAATAVRRRPRPRRLWSAHAAPGDDGDRPGNLRGPCDRLRLG
jgi:hypothetical protein